MKSYLYVNGLNRLKKIVVQDITEEGDYPISLWDMETGEWCGNGNFTPEKLQEFFNHYGIKDCD